MEYPTLYSNPPLEGMSSPRSAMDHEEIYLSSSQSLRPARALISFFRKLSFGEALAKPGVSILMVPSFFPITEFYVFDERNAADPFDTFPRV